MEGFNDDYIQDLYPNVVVYWLIYTPSTVRKNYILLKSKRQGGSGVRIRFFNARSADSDPDPDPVK